MKKNNSMSRNLRFKNEATEREYLESRQQTLFFIIIAVLVYSMFVSITTWFINADGNFKTDPVFYGFRIAMIVLSLVILIYYRMKKINILIFLFYLLVFLTFLALGETYKKNMNQGWRIPYFALGLYKQALALILIMAKLRWIKILIFVIFSDIMSCFRYLDFQEDIQSRFIIVFHIILNMIILCVFSYISEKKDREFFIALKIKREKLMRNLTDLIQNTFPIPIVVTNGDKILLENEEISKAFPLIEPSSDLIDRYSKIVIDAQIDAGESFGEEELRREGLFNHETKADRILLTELLEGSQRMSEKPKDPEKYKLSNLIKRCFTILKSESEFLINLFGYHRSEETNAKSYFEIKIKKIYWGDSPAFIIIFSENKLVQKLRNLREQTEYKDQILANISHDLRTPLNGMIGILSQSLEMIKDKALKKSIKFAFLSAKILQISVNDIIDYQQTMLNTLKLDLNYFSLWDLVREISKFVKVQANIKGLEFKIENKITQCNPSAFILSDPNRIKQIILNILMNALKSTFKGSIRVILEENMEDSLVQLGADHASFLVKVIDTGLGFNQEEIQTLLSFPNKKKLSKYAINRSVGLGLAFSQNLVKILNGNSENCSINVSSSVGHGSCYYFPIKTFSDSRNEENFGSLINEPFRNTLTETEETLIGTNLLKPNNNDQATLEMCATRKLRLLIVDDDPINILVASSYAKSLNDCDYYVAYNGLEAVDKVKEMAHKKLYFDLILMDLNMPQMNGAEATLLIRKMAKSGAIRMLA